MKLTNFVNKKYIKITQYIYFYFVLELASCHMSSVDENEATQVPLLPPMESTGEK